MDYRVSVIKLLPLLTFFLHLSSADTHTLWFLYTEVTPGINIPEFTAVVQVDEEQSAYYDSNLQNIIPRTEWIKKIKASDPKFWNRETQRIQSDQKELHQHLSAIMKNHNHTKGVHTLQRMYGCELHNNSTTRGYDQYGYDGEDFISLDLKTETWTAANDKAVLNKDMWGGTGVKAKQWNKYLEKCTEWLKKFVSFGRETLERKVQPEVLVFQKHSSSPEVVCHATGFFPKALNITWQKDREDVYEDVELSETLPNQDGSFQRRSVLNVSAEELQKHKYTCVIQHSSLEEDLVLPVRGGGSRAQIGIIITGVVVGLLFLIAGVGIVWRKTNSCERRVKTGFMLVSQKTYSTMSYSANSPERVTVS